MKPCRRTRSYAIVAIFVAAAVLTPTPDVFTLLLMALPMIMLYEICIWLAWFDRRKNRVAEEQEAREREERLLRPAARRNPPTTAESDPHRNHGPIGTTPITHRRTRTPHEAGDDGWTAELTRQQDSHDRSEEPEIPELPDRYDCRRSRRRPSDAEAPHTDPEVRPTAR